MLNQAATSPPVKSSPPPGPFLSSSQSTSQQHLNPPSSTVREPSPLPPPPPISSLSLNDLFKNIGSPPPPPSQPAGMAGSSAQQPSPPASQQLGPPVLGSANGSGSGNVHQNKLLGMLAGVTANGTSGVDRSKAVSPSGGSGVQTPLGADQQVNLLSMFKRWAFFSFSRARLTWSQALPCPSRSRSSTTLHPLTSLRPLSPRRLRDRQIQVLLFHSIQTHRYHLLLDRQQLANRAPSLRCLPNRHSISYRHSMRSTNRL